MQTFLRFLSGRQVLSVSLWHSGDTAMPMLELLLRGAFPGHAITVEKRSGEHQLTKLTWSQIRYEILLPCTADTLHATVVATSRALRDICLTPEMVYS
ncbi:MAG: hypothetical protein E6Q97_35920 [Desulfurellales bacterium]|nr:MAG: hypothetical protein E6Q97_35920 [Desulfurellales bacterium]